MQTFDQSRPWPPNLFLRQDSHRTAMQNYKSVFWWFGGLAIVAKTPHSDFVILAYGVHATCGHVQRYCTRGG